MLFAAPLIALTAAFGYAVTRQLPVRMLAVETAAFSAGLGLLGAAWILGLPSLVLPYVLALPLGALIMLAATILLLRRPRASQPAPELSRRAKLGWVVVTGGVSIAFCYFSYINTLPAAPTGLWTAQSSYGDIALHTTLVTWFAGQDRLVLKLPVLHDTGLSYPWLLDFYSAVLYRLGASLSFSLQLPALILALAVVQLVAGLGWRLFGRAAAGLLAIVLYFFGGSVWNAGTFLADWHTSGQPFWYFFTHLQQTYAYLLDFRVQLVNPIVMLVPQRTELLGHVALFAVIALVAAGIRRPAGAPGGSRGLVMAGVITGLLPFAHIHTFIVAGLVMLTGAVVRGARLRRVPTAWIAAGLLALVIAAPQLVWQLVLTPHVQLGNFTLGWHLDGESYWLAVFKAFGVALPLGVITAIILLRRRVPGAWLFIPGVMLAVFSGVYIMQPWGFDNMKLIAYAYLILCLFVAYGVVSLRQAWLRRAAVGVVVVLMTASSVPALAREATSRVVEFGPDDVALGDWVRYTTEPDARFVIAGRHNSPLTALGGREAVIGYAGWLWTYGIDYTATETDSKAMLAVTDADETRALLARYDVDFIAIGLGDEANQAFYDTNYAKAYNNGSWTVYRVR